MSNLLDKVDTVNALSKWKTKINDSASNLRAAGTHAISAVSEYQTAKLNMNEQEVIDTGLAAGAIVFSQEEAGMTAIAQVLFAHMAGTGQTFEQVVVKIGAKLQEVAAALAPAEGGE